MLLRRHKLCFFSFLHVSFYTPLFPLSVVMVVVVVVDDDDEGMNQWMVWSVVMMMVAVVVVWAYMNCCCCCESIDIWMLSGWPIPFFWWKNVHIGSPSTHVEKSFSMKRCSLLSHRFTKSASLYYHASITIHYFFLRPRSTFSLLPPIQSIGFIFIPVQ